MGKAYPKLDILPMIAIIISYVAILVSVIFANIFAMKERFRVAIFVLSLSIIVGFGITIMYIFTSP